MRVLVVDDSPVYQRVLKRSLVALGHECAIAADGEEAWERFQREGADAVISNWLMPGMDGDELCRRIRGSDRSYAYFIFFTARDAKKSLMDGMEAGADDYLAKPLDEADLAARLVAAARVTALHRRLDEQQRELERLNGELFAQSRHDPLTTLRNRLALREELDALDGRADRDGSGYAVILCDVDRFKAYNDSQGHQAGDAVLRDVAKGLLDSSRRGDTAYRYGGEELVMLIPDDDPAAAATAAERIRSTVEALAIPHPAVGPGAVVTISAGVAVRRNGRGDSGSEALRRADAALYRAKEDGRNRVVAG
jgi:diguanylate cyclase (GGDEF)-like protein